ncbi:MAG: hypothetical protein JSU94_13335 [Phycisphaerales bacterium]|nr:MAG: hypothetical protein JSU94_13335 [Phycisphaerales bacterium]
MDPEICYLCGQSIEGTASRDHVPPRQFFTRMFRKTKSPNLLTLPTHAECNKSYQDDEDYFFASLAPITEQAYIHDWLMEEAGNKLSRQHSQGLREKVMSEFNSTVAGLYLPRHLIAKIPDWNRVGRVVWKVVRGLCYHHYLKFLPEETTHRIRYCQTSDPPPPIYTKYLLEAPLLASHPEVFAHRFAGVSNPGSLSGLWALIFWQSLVAIVVVLVGHGESRSGACASSAQ